MALSGSEFDEAKPFDNVMEWLELLDFRVRMMDQNFLESHRVEARFWKKGCLAVRILETTWLWMVLYLTYQSRHLESLKTLEKTFMESDVMSNVTINSGNWTIKVTVLVGMHLLMTDRKEVDQRFQKSSMSSDSVANGRDPLGVLWQDWHWLFCNSAWLGHL